VHLLAVSHHLTIVPSRRAARFRPLAVSRRAVRRVNDAHVCRTEIKENSVGQYHLVGHDQEVGTQDGTTKN